MGDDHHRMVYERYFRRYEAACFQIGGARQIHGDGLGVHSSHLRAQNYYRIVRPPPSRRLLELVSQVRDFVIFLTEKTFHLNK